MKLVKTITVFIAAGALALAGCSANNSQSDAEKLDVMASFYPLVYVTEQVGGEFVNVQSMTPAGAEPHDLELSAKTQDDIAKVDAVVYLKGFQPSVDKAVEQAAPKHVAEVSEVVDLLDVAELSGHDDADGDHAEHDHDGAEEGHDHDGPEEGHDHDGAEEGHDHDGAEEGHDHDGAEEGHHHHDMGGKDPHFWLDTDRMVRAAYEVAEVLGEADPDHEDEYMANAEKLRDRLQELGGKIGDQLMSCKTPTIIVGHEAYGYLGLKHHFTQVGISGVDPEQSTSPARLKEISDIAKEHNVNVIFTETLIQDKDAKVLADDLGIKTEVLDPLENQADPNKDYIQVMEENGKKLAEAMQCEK